MNLDRHRCISVSSGKNIHRYVRVRRCCAHMVTRGEPHVWEDFTTPHYSFSAHVVSYCVLVCVLRSQFNKMCDSKSGFLHTGDFIPSTNTFFK